MFSASSDLLFNRLKVRDVIIAYILLLTITIVAVMIPGEKITSDFFTPVVYILSMVTTSLWVFLRLQKLRINHQDIIGKLPPRIEWFRLVGIVLALMAFSLSAVILLFGLLYFLAPSFLTEALKDSDLKIVASDALAKKVITFIAIVVVAPITEEFLFRGIILKRWAEKWNIGKALIFSSLFFGFLHFNFIGASMFGLVMGLLYIKTKTLWIPIGCHALNNFVVFLLMSFSSETSSGEVTLQDFQYAWIIGLMLMIIPLPFLLRFINRNFSSSKSRQF